MKKVAYAQSISDLSKLDQLKIDEIIISSKDFSRFAENSFIDLIEMINLKSKIKSNLVFEWDTLLTENNFVKVEKIFKNLPIHEFASIRVQDPGVVKYIKEHYSWLKIQLILETGNHNLIGLKRWKEYLGEQLERIILSNELSKEHLNLYSNELKLPLEILTFGRILLFYSPRKLLSPLEISNIENDVIKTYGTSEESPHSGFPILENQHGTFMFNVKDLSLLEHIDELKQMNISALRIDNRFDQNYFNLSDVLSYFEGHGDKKLVGPRPFVKGFYNINKTDVLFSKLKNKKTLRNDKNYVGEVLDVEKGEYLCIQFKNNINFTFPTKFKLITPEGKIKNIEVSNIKTTYNKEIAQVDAHGLGIVPYVNGVTTKTQVYFLE